MKYKRVKAGTFLSRPNRFIAIVEVEGRREIVHVKHTGRCRELFLPGATVYLEDHREELKTRKTRWDLIAVEKSTGGKDSGKTEVLLVNMDSQAPNKVVAEALASGMIRLPDFPEKFDRIKPEATFKSSRFDFYVEAELENGAKKRAYIEVKGVTLEESRVGRFPDAPTERGVKHLRELCEAKKQGFYAYVIFIVQMAGIREMGPNDKTHKAFGDELRRVQKEGVDILAYNCVVETDGLCVGEQILIRL